MAEVLPEPPAPTNAIVRASPPRSAITGMRRASAGADQLLDATGLRERQAVGDGLGHDVLGQAGAEAGGDQALLVRVGDVRAVGAEGGRGRCLASRLGEELVHGRRGIISTGGATGS